MRASPTHWLVLATLTLGLGSVVRAQLQTYDTRPYYAGSAITFNANGTLGQTFTNVSAVKSMTYDFFAGTGGNNTPTTLSAVFGQWNGSSFVNGSTVSFGTINVPAQGGSGWTSTLTNGTNGNTYANFAYTFDLSTLSSGLIDSTYGYLTNPNNTYALMLTNTTVDNNNSSIATGLALGLTNADVFAYGATNLGFNDWTFAQIVVAPGNQQLTPIPEPSTVAAIAGAVFVAGLVVLRLRQRQLALIPVRAA